MQGFTVEALKLAAEAIVIASNTPSGANLKVFGSDQVAGFLPWLLGPDFSEGVAITWYSSPPPAEERRNRETYKTFDAIHYSDAEDSQREEKLKKDEENTKAIKEGIRLRQEKDQRGEKLKKDEENTKAIKEGIRLRQEKEKELAEAKERAEKFAYESRIKLTDFLPDGFISWANEILDRKQKTRNPSTRRHRNLKSTATGRGNRKRHPNRK